MFSLSHQPSEASLVGCQWQHVPLRVALNDLRSFIYLQIIQHGAYRTAQQTDDNCPAADRDLVVRMRAIVPAPIFPACGDAPHILLCRAVIVPNDSAVLTYTVTVDCGLSFTLLYIFDCSENATAELGRNARYQAHPASVPSTGHRAVSLFQLTEV